MPTFCTYRVAGNFCDFCGFQAIRKNKFPHIKITTNIYPQNFTPELVFSTLNSLQKTLRRNRVCLKSCLLHSETKRYTMNYWFYIGYAYHSVVWEYIFCCTYLTKTHIKITANIFAAKIYSRVNILHLKFATQDITKKSCLSEIVPLSFRNKTVYNELLVLHRVGIP